MKKQHQRISSIQELDDYIGKDNPLDCFVLLNFGIRSSKQISFNENGDYVICNECDGTEEVINHGNLMNTFIGEAISKGALYKY